jgi:hypothetical protein
MALLFFLLRKRRSANDHNHPGDTQAIDSLSSSRTHWSALISHFSLAKAVHDTTDLTISPISPSAPQYDEKADFGPYQLDSREMDRLPNLDSSPIHELAAVEVTRRLSSVGPTGEVRRRTESGIIENDHVMSWAS